MPRRKLPLAADDSAPSSAPPAAALPARKRRILARLGPAAHGHGGGVRFEDIIPRLIDMRYASDIVELIDVSPVFRAAPPPSASASRWDYDLLYRALLDSRREPSRGIWKWAFGRGVPTAMIMVILRSATFVIHWFARIASGMYASAAIN